MIVKNDLIVTHSNRLTEARYALSVNEQRVVLFMISQIQPSDDELKDYVIKINDFAKLLGISNKNIYADIKKLLRGLVSKVLYIPNNDGYLMTNWVSSAKYIDSEGTIKLSFDKNLKPYLLMLKEQFTKYRLFTVTQFRSAYSIRLYMLLKQYVSIGTREFDLSELRVILGLKDGQYPLFYEFRRRIINTVQKEFSKKDKSGAYVSDVNFDLETITYKRKVVRLRFIIRSQQISPQIELPISSEMNIPSIVYEYEAYGIDRSIVLLQFKKQGEQALKDCLLIFKKKLENTDMKNPSGYLLGMLNNGAGRKTRIEAEKERQKQKELQEKKEAEYQKKLQEKREELERQFSKVEIDRYLSGVTDEEKADLLAQAKKENPMLSSLMTSLDSPMCLPFLLPRIPDYEKNKEEYIKKNLKP